MNLLRVNLYIGTVDQQLSSFRGANHQKVTEYSSIFALLLPLVGVVSVPFVGWSLDKFGIWFSVVLLCVSGNLYALTSLFFMFPLPVQIITFVMVGIFRALLFSVMATFVAVRWGFEDFGKLWGIIFLFGGVINVGIIYVAYVVNSHLDENYFWINVAMSFLSLLLSAYPVYLGYYPPPDMSGKSVQ